MELTRKKYKNKPGELSKKARKKFKKSSDNTGELLLYCSDCAIARVAISPKIKN